MIVKESKSVEAERGDLFHGVAFACPSTDVETAFSEEFATLAHLTGALPSAEPKFRSRPLGFRDFTEICLTVLEGADQSPHSAFLPDG